MGRLKALTPEQARELVKLSRQGSTDQELSERFGIAVHTVADIRCGRSYAPETGVTRRPTRTGPKPQLSDAQAAELLARFREGIPRLRLAREFAVSRAVVDAIVTGRAYRHATGILAPAHPSAQKVVASQNLRRVQQVRGSVCCVECRTLLRRTVGSVQKAGGVTFCQNCNKGVD